MTQTNNESGTRAWLRHIPSLIVVTIYVSGGLGLISTLMWGRSGIGVCLLAMAYVRFELVRLWVNRRAECESENEIVNAAAFKILRRAGFACLVAVVLMFVALSAGEGWGWLIPAAFGFWLAIVIIFPEQLGPRDMPARWFP